MDSKSLPLPVYNNTSPPVLWGPLNGPCSPKRNYHGTPKLWLARMQRKDGGVAHHNVSLGTGRNRTAPLQRPRCYDKGPHTAEPLPVAVKKKKTACRWKDLLSLPTALYTGLDSWCTRALEKRREKEKGRKPEDAGSPAKAAINQGLPYRTRGPLSSRCHHQDAAPGRACVFSSSLLR